MKRSVSFIGNINSSSNNLKRILFEKLLDNFSDIIVDRLVLHCTFAYYAFTTYQLENGNYENELWFVFVLTKAIKMKITAVEKHLPIIAHFALLFHSSHTQILLKRICKQLQVPYFRRTLSTKSIRILVEKIQTSLNQVCEDLVPQRSPRRLSFPGDEYLSVNEKWANEAVRWAIGSRQLKNAQLSLVILNSLKYDFDDNNVTELLKGICRSTAYFLKNATEIDSQLEEFINETFVLFYRHFENHEEFAFDYLNSFLNFVVLVDAYFEAMLQLFQKCLESKTKSKAIGILLPVLRPTFNELETDANTLGNFRYFLSMTKGMSESVHNDLEFVDMILRKDELDQIKERVNSASTDCLNRAIIHYSLMVETASIDLNHRILHVASLILQKITRERDEAKQRSRNATGKSLKPSDFSSLYMNNEESKTFKLSQVRQIGKPTTSTSEKDKEVNESQNAKKEEKVKNDLDKHALLQLFKTANHLLPQSAEALQFINDVSMFDPLISTYPGREKANFKQDVQAIISDLEQMGRHENEIVTLTDCTHFDSTSNLLNEDCKPKIRPFTTQHEVVESLRPVARVDKWLRTLSSVSIEFKKKMIERCSPHFSILKGQNYQEIPLPKAVKRDEDIPKEERPDCSVTPDAFLKLSDVEKSETSRMNEKFNVSV